jgi:hypothetical protein
MGRTGSSSSSRIAASRRSSPSAIGRPGRWHSRRNTVRGRPGAVSAGASLPNDEPMTKLLRAVQWQVDHFAEIPVLVVPCLGGGAREGANLVTLPLWSVTSPASSHSVGHGAEQVAHLDGYGNPRLARQLIGLASRPVRLPGMAVLTRASAKLAANRARRLSRDPGAAAAEARRSAGPAW